MTTGKANTAGLVALGTSTSDAPYYAANYCGGMLNTNAAFGYTTWYLPATNELNVLYTNRTAIGNFDTTDGSTLVNGGLPGEYWTASETANNDATEQNFNTGTTLNSNGKINKENLRCVRR
jgi:hypothetical protein